MTPLKEQKEGQCGWRRISEGGVQRTSEKQRPGVEVKEHGFCPNVMGSPWQVLTRGEKKI